MAKTKQLEACLVKGSTYGINTDRGYVTYVKGRWVPIVSEQEYNVLAKSDAFLIREAGKGAKGHPEWNEGEEGGGEETAETTTTESVEEKPAKSKGKGKKK